MCLVSKREKEEVFWAFFSFFSLFSSLRLSFVVCARVCVLLFSLSLSLSLLVLNFDLSRLVQAALFCVECAPRRCALLIKSNSPSVKSKHIMREPLTKTKTKKKEALRATLEKDDAQTDFSERTNRNGDDGSARKERLGEDVLTVRDSSATRVQGKSRLEEIHGRDSRRRGETDEGK